MNAFRYFRNYVTIMCQGRDHLKKAIHFRSFNCVQHMFSKYGAYIPLLQGHGSMFGKKKSLDASRY